MRSITLKMIIMSHNVLYYVTHFLKYNKNQIDPSTALKRSRAPSKATRALKIGSFSEFLSRTATCEQAVIKAT